MILDTGPNGGGRPREGVRRVNRKFVKQRPEGTEFPATWPSNPDTPCDCRRNKPAGLWENYPEEATTARKIRLTLAKKTIKLAPFRFPFSKLSKSRSSDDKDKEKDRENDKEKEDEEAEEKNGERKLSMNQLQLTAETNSAIKSPTAESNSLMVRNESAIPSSPPPSYEHVLEQTRLKHAAKAQRQEDKEITEKQIPRTEKNSGTPSGEHKTVAKGPEILHKSSKEFYRAMAKQWGITCEMSDHCRCLDCQSHYFDCEYEKNEHHKTDGGLGAGTPMFISEVMHGSGCVLL